MNPNAATTTESRLARRLWLQTEGDCMTLQVPRFGLSLLVGVATDRRLVLLHYDRATDPDLFRKADAIAAFLGVPLNTRMRARLPGRGH